jgi:hypothetical protein
VRLSAEARIASAPLPATSFRQETWQRKHEPLVTQPAKRPVLRQSASFLGSEPCSRAYKPRANKTPEGNGIWTNDNFERVSDHRPVSIVGQIMKEAMRLVRHLRHTLLRPSESCHVSAPSSQSRRQRDDGESSLSMSNVMSCIPPFKNRT